MIDEKYTIPIGMPKRGSGTIIGNFFVTAAHVIQNDVEIVYFEGKEIILRKKDAVVFETVDHPNQNGLDVAIYKLENIKSEIEFCTDEPEIGNEFISISFIDRIEKTDFPLSVFSSQYNIQKQNCLARYISKHNNYYECETSEILSEGSSGSPIFLNNKLVGILHGGVPNTHTCFFQSVKSFLPLLIKNI